MKKSKFVSFILIFCFLISTVCVISNIPQTIASGIVLISQGANGYAQGSANSGSSVNITLASTPTNGNVLIASICFETVTLRSVSTITETGVTWYYVTNESSVAPTYYVSEIWLGVIGVGASKTINVTLSGSSSLALVVDVCEWTGISTSGYLDKVAGNRGSSTTSDSGTISTTAPNELWVCAIAARYNQSSATNGFTLLDGVQTKNYVGNAYLYKNVLATGQANTGTSLKSGTWVGCIATFKELTPISSGPISSGLTTSSSNAGASCDFGVTWTDSKGLSIIGGYIFGTNNTGTWINETWTGFTSNPQTVTITKILSSNIGDIVQYEWWANDTSGVWADTGIQSLTIIGIVLISQGANGYAQGSANSGSSVNITLASTPTNGNVLIASICFETVTLRSVSTITETGVTWYYVTNESSVAPTYYVSEIWLGVIGVGASKTINVTLSGSSSLALVVDVCEWTGISTSGYLDKVAGNRGSSTTSDSGTISTTAPNELWVCAIAARYNQSSATNGFTLLDGVQTKNYVGNAYLYKNVLATGQANTGTSLKSGTWVGCIATFKELTPISSGPISSGLTTSSSNAGASCDFGVTWTDSKGLSIIGGYIFGTNNTGTWINETWTGFTSNPQTVTITKILSSNIGDIVQYEWWANDTSGVWADTGIQSLTITSLQWSGTLNGIQSNQIISINGIPIGGIKKYQWNNLEIFI